MSADRTSIPPPPLSGGVVGSFAYRTIKDRLPVIITKIVDDLYRNRNKYLDTHGQDFDDAIKFIIKELSGLRHEVTTDKPLVVFQESGSPDLLLWNSALEEAKNGDTLPTWYSTSWLLAECYMYRRMVDIVLKSGAPYFDMFHSAKRASYVTCESQQRQVTMHLLSSLGNKDALQNDLDYLRTKFLEFLELSLWGNVYDLSISGLEQQDFTHAPPNPVELLELVRDNILVNQADKLWTHLQERRPSRGRTLALLLDNAGMELVNDLCFCQFLLKTQLFTKILLFGKSMPWFVSDTTHADIEWTLRELSASNHLGQSRLAQWVRDSLALGTMVYQDHAFWTLPYSYERMATVAPDLYQSLREVDLVVFKGDLHYRKLLGDLDWPSTTPLAEALPDCLKKDWAPFCALRVMKSDAATDVPLERSQELQEKEPDWRVRGDYAQLQFYLP